MTTIDSGTSSFDLGRVIQRTFQVIGRNFATFGIAAVILAGIPAFISAFGQGSALTNGEPGALAAILIGGALSLVGTYVLQAAIVYGTVNTFNGRTVSLGAAMGVGFRHFLPLLGLAILVGLCIGLGTILLIVPGLIIAVLWCVAAPALVVEKRSIFSSLQRSRDLTRGYRWPIFGLIVIYFIVYMIIFSAIGALGVATGGTFVDGSGVLAFNLIVTPLSTIVVSIIGSAGVAAIYYELRTAKEGVGAEQMASVFD